MRETEEGWASKMKRFMGEEKFKEVGSFC